MPPGKRKGHGRAGFGREFDDGFSRNRSTLDILRRLAPGTIVRVWFDSSGFITGVFQFIVDDEVAFTSFAGSGFDGGLTYVKATDIRAINVGPIFFSDTKE